MAYRFGEIVFSMVLSQQNTTALTVKLLLKVKHTNSASWWRNKKNTLRSRYTTGVVTQVPEQQHGHQIIGK